MQKGNSRAIATKALSVEILLLDGSAMSGRLWVPIQGRLSDVLNDDRTFIPLECRDGSILALAKSAIKQVLFPAAEVAAYRGSNPWLILGVREGVSHDDLKKAYYQLCAHNHPDRIRGLGLGPDYEELATQNMMRINSAYTQVLKTMGMRS